MMRAWASALGFVALCVTLFLAPGCATHQPQGSSIEEPNGIERPAVALDEEEDLWDHAGEVGIVILVIGIAIGGILLPILLL
jgi:hypothetical protein